MCDEVIVNFVLTELSSKSIDVPIDKVERPYYVAERAIAENPGAV
jgi:hypothetical protein